MQPNKTLATAQFNENNHQEFEHSYQASKQTFKKAIEI
jgi:hypothetical protein